MQTVHISAERTAELVGNALGERYPTTVFSVRLEEPSAGRRDLRGVDVVWVEGPTREEVERVIDRFQGVSWDPRTGSLDSRTHMIVGSDGQLQEVYYDIDYVFCDGPTTVLYR